MHWRALDIFTVINADSGVAAGAGAVTDVTRLRHGHYISRSRRNSRHFCYLWMVERVVFPFYTNWIEIKSQTIVFMFQFFFPSWFEGGRHEFRYFLVRVHLWFAAAAATAAADFDTKHWLNNCKTSLEILYICVLWHLFDWKQFTIYIIRSPQMNNLSLLPFVCLFVCLCVCVLDFWCLLLVMLILLPR